MRWWPLWLAWVGAVLVIGAVLFGRGVALDTRLADVAPRSERPAAVQALAERADAFAASAVRLVLVGEGASEERVVAATAALAQRLDTMVGVERLDAGQRESRLIERLAPHRFSLLPVDVARALDDARPDRLADEAIAALYAPELSLRALPIDADPLNLLGEWLDERLSALVDRETAAPIDGEPSAARPHGLIEARLSGDDERTAIRQLERAGAQVMSEHPGVRVLRTGVPFFAAEAAERSRSDIDRITIGSLIGLLALLLPVFRSAWPLLLPGLSIAVGAASGAVLVLLVHGSMHVLTLVFGASLIGIVIDYSVHGFAHRAASASGDAARTRRTADTAKPSGTGRSTRTPPPLLRALTLSLLTSGIGYAALGLSSVQALAHVALFSVGGLLGAWLTVVAWLPMMAGPGLRWQAGWVDGLARRLLALADRAAQLAGLSRAARSPRRTLPFVLVSVLLLGLALSRLQADDDPRRLIELSPSLIEQTRTIATLTEEADVARRYLISADDVDDVWQALTALRTSLPEGVGLRAVDDWLASPSRMAQDRQRSQVLLDDEGPAAQVMEALGDGDAPMRLQALREELAADVAAPLRVGTLLDDPLLGLPPLLEVVEQGPGASALALVVRRGEGSPVPADALRAAIDAATLPAGVKVTLVDTVADTAATLGDQRRSASALLAAAVLGVCCLLGAVYRRTGALALVAVPGGAIVATLATLSLLGVPLTLFHVLGLFLVLGLGMDYTIFLAELGERARQSTLAAIVLSAATSLLSFGLLASSSIPVARFFAQTVFIGNAFSLLFTFLLLAVLGPPALARVRAP